MAARENSQGMPIHRMEALSDGVFAIAMTLLVLELRAPESDHETSNGLAQALWAMWPKFASLVLGFVLLGSLWVGQYFQFLYIRRCDRVLLWIHLAFLLVCSVMPFAVSLLGVHGPSTLVCAIYGGLLLVAGTFLFLSWSYASKERLWADASLSDATVKALRARIWLGMGVYGAGFVVAFFMPRLSLVLYALMPLLYVIPGKIDRHAKTREVTGF